MSENKNMSMSVRLDEKLAEEFRGISKELDITHADFLKKLLKLYYDSVGEVRLLIKDNNNKSEVLSFKGRGLDSFSCYRSSRHKTIKWLYDNLLDKNKYKIEDLKDESNTTEYIYKLYKIENEGFKKYLMYECFEITKNRFKDKESREQLVNIKRAWMFDNYDEFINNKDPRFNVKGYLNDDEIEDIIYYIADTISLEDLQ